MKPVMQMIVQGIQVSVELTSPQWERLNKLDFTDDVEPVLVEAGAYSRSVDYNGHFGRAIFFTVASMEEGNTVLDSIKLLIGDE